MVAEGEGTEMAKGEKSSSCLTLMPSGVEELKQSLQRVETLMDEAPVGICHTDLKGKFTYVNKRFEKSSGYSREEVVGKNGFKLGMFSSQTLKLLRERIKDRLAGRPSRVLELQFKRKDGHWIWVSMEGRLIWERGIPVGFQLISSDITERKRAEEALERQKAYFQQLFDNSPEAIALLDTDDRVVNINKGFEVLFGYRIDEVKGRFINDVVVPEDRIEEASAMSQASLNNQVVRKETVRKRNDGSLVDVSAVGYPIWLGNKAVGVYAIYTDITERKRAEEALRESEERFRSIVENSHDGIMILDDAHRFIYVNDELCRISGYSREEVVGLDFREFLDEESKQLVAERYVRRQRGEEIPPRYEFNFVHKDGQKRRVEISSAVIKYSAGKVKTVAQILDITERKRAEEALHQSEQKYRNLFELAPYAIVTVDKKGVITSCNAVTLNFTGYSKDEIVGKHFSKLSFLRLSDIPKYMKLFISLLKGSVPEPFEVSYQTKDGTTRWVQAHAGLLGVDVGNEVFQVAFGDITERKRAEQALRQSEEKLRTYLESAPDGVYINDLQGTFLYGNKKAEEIIGYRKEELIGKSFLKLNILPAKYLAKAGKLLALNAIGRPTGPDEFELIKKDGTRVWVEISTTPIKQAEGKTEVIAFVRDITERKQAEQALERQKAHFQQLFDNSPDAIALLDTDDRVVNINKGFEVLFGYRIEEVKGRFINDVVVPEDRIEEASAMSRAALSNEARRKETVRERKDGSLVDVSVLHYSIKFDDKPVGVYAIYSDITERKRAEQALKEAQEQLHRSEKLAAIGQLAGGVGHELRNPLGAIKNAIFYVRRRIAKSDLPATEPKVMEFLDTIDKEVNSANKVITDLLGFSRVAKPTVSSVNIGGMIEAALEHVPMPGNVELTRNIDPSLPMVMVDGSQIQQVFANIILNAIEAMPEGGRLEIIARSKDDFVQVRFTDTGCGIPQSIISKIFDPLFTTKAKGIGLGLAMCKSTLERHGGDIQVETEEGKGTTFTISLPTKEV